MRTPIALLAAGAAACFACVLPEPAPDGGAPGGCVVDMDCAEGEICAEGACAPGAVGDGGGDALDGGPGDAGWPDAGVNDAGQIDAGAMDGGPPETGPTGFIGSPCDDVSDCEYADAVCAQDAPGGVCTQACTLYCPDQDGHPTTFCVDDAELPPEVSGLGDGACLSRCDYLTFPGAGCRPGYGCVPVPRANEPGTIKYACVPGAEPEPPSDCQAELAALGVTFTPLAPIVDSPSTHPNLTCVVEDPVRITPPIHGVDFVYTDGVRYGITASCAMAQALVQTADHAAAEGVVEIMHIGTYNCRVIAGTNTLSRHAYGDAIDIYGYTFDDGTVYTLIDDWDGDPGGAIENLVPTSAGGIWLYDTAYYYYDNFIWNIVLTPNFNSAHANHFHVDLTPMSHSIGAVEGRYIGVSPHND